jgi:TIR domain
MLPENPVPEVYVLWHPACWLGETLASKIYGWLRPTSGLGPQVFYRSAPAPESVPGGLPPPLPGESRTSGVVSKPRRSASNLQIVLPLIDDNMIADASWRSWLQQLASAPTGIRVTVPVALDSTAFNAPPPVRELNFLRPAGLPLGEDNNVDRVTRSLLKQLTEALCRLLLRSGSSQRTGSSPRDGGTPKVKIFLSHAKADGTTPARRIRDYIYSQTQIAAFYDENDIPFGSAFARVLKSNVSGAETAALIAIHSALYAKRPWCRREVSLFRCPLQESQSRWTMNPVLVVDALEGGASTQGVPELGNAPIVRWASEAVEQEEQIVTTVLRDALLAEFHNSASRAIQETDKRIIINWLPDPVSLLRIPPMRDRSIVEVHYPGRGLSALELDILDELFPAVAFHSFEESLQ